MLNSNLSSDFVSDTPLKLELKTDLEFKIKFRDRPKIRKNSCTTPSGHDFSIEIAKIQVSVTFDSSYLSQFCKKSW